VVSFEPTGTFSPANYSLVGTPGTCTDAEVDGVYVLGVALNSQNTVVISVNVATIGTWSINTIVTGGMAFAGEGNFTTTGIQTIELTGGGTPAAAGITNIPISVNGTNCSFPVEVIDKAIFTIDCTSPVLSGTFKASTPMNGNTVTIKVNVTQPGGYVFTTAANNGVLFTGVGIFTTTGQETITLYGVGTPTANGTFNYVINWGNAGCSFPIQFGNSTNVWSFKEAASTFSGSQVDMESASILGPNNALSLRLTYTGITITNETFTVILTDEDGNLNENETYNTNATTGNTASFSYVGINNGYIANSSKPSANLVFSLVSVVPQPRSLTIGFTGQAFTTATTPAIVNITEGSIFVAY